jgi:hypothetical protein
MAERKETAAPSPRRPPSPQALAGLCSAVVYDTRAMVASNSPPASLTALSYQTTLMPPV